MTQEEKTKIEEKIVDVLKTVYDPEIPVNIWDLGMIYKIDVKDDATVDLDMTFTAPSCPAALRLMLSRKRTSLRSCILPCGIAHEPRCASERKYTFFISDSF